MKNKQTKCPSCKKKLEIDETLKDFFCTYCGSKIYIEGEQVNLKSKEDAKTNDEKTRKEFGEYLPIVIWLGVMIIFVLLCVAMSLFSPNGKFSNEITVPNDYKYYEGENYKEVVEELTDAGFENITIKEIEDLVIGWITKDGEVEKVSINGSTEFEKR